MSDALSDLELDVLADIGPGADVRGTTAARVARELERRGLVTITKSPVSPDEKDAPYFRAAWTGEGCRRAEPYRTALGTIRYCAEVHQGDMRDVIARRSELAMTYARDGAYGSAARVLSQLAQAVTGYAVSEGILPAYFGADLSGAN